jgi:hypothetical protein
MQNSLQDISNNKSQLFEINAYNYKCMLIVIEQVNLPIRKYISEALYKNISQSCYFEIQSHIMLQLNELTTSSI